MTFDIGQTSSSVFGIVGMGVSLGVLAGTAGMVMRSMDHNLYGKPRPRVQQRRPTTKRKKRVSTYTDFYNPYRDQIKIPISRRW